MPIVLIPTQQELKHNPDLVGIESPKLTYPGDCVCQTLWQSHYCSQQGNEHHVIEKQPAKDVSHPSPIMRTLYKWQLTPPPCWISVQLRQMIINLMGQDGTSLLHSWTSCQRISNLSVFVVVWSQGLNSENKCFKTANFCKSNRGQRESSWPPSCKQIYIGLTNAETPLSECKGILETSCSWSKFQTAINEISPDAYCTWKSAIFLYKIMISRSSQKPLHFIKSCLLHFIKAAARYPLPMNNQLLNWRHERKNSTTQTKDSMA